MISRLQLHFLRHAFMVAALLSFFQNVQASPPEPAPVLKLVPGSVSKDGHAKLVWEVSPADAEVEVQQAQDVNFRVAKTIYCGRDNATFVSGLENGMYYYRTRQANGAWSEPVMLKVKHHSLRLASILFSLGAVVFAFTVFIVVKGARYASVD